MGSENEAVEERLKSFLRQLQVEYGILDRIVYKNKNQHRRSSYFQYLLKVRSDLRLLQSANFEEILNSSFLVIHGKRPKQKVQLLERMSETAGLQDHAGKMDWGGGWGTRIPKSIKRRKRDGEKHSFLERLLGAARLLSQMVKPMLKGAMFLLILNAELSLRIPLLEISIMFFLTHLGMCSSSLTMHREISTLLARSFFMGFSLTVLALLARLRVLVQQVQQDTKILLDVVTVFNRVSSLSQKEQSVKLTQERLEVFREYYPTNEGSVSLDRIWEKDTFVLLERVNEPKNRLLDMDVREDVSLGASAIHYQSIETLLGDDEFVKLESCTSEAPVGVSGDNTDDHAPRSDDAKQVEDNKVEPSYISEGPHVVAGDTRCREAKQVEDDKVEDGSGVAEAPSEDLPSEGGLLTSSLTRPNPHKVKSWLRDNVAFVSVKRPAPSRTKVEGFHIKGTDGNNDGRDPFLSLLTAGNLKENLF
ncbi:hypothetical protein RJ639_043140 [Escallonia herrerae]|uniref:Nucleolus and neural progenitor protein-like N-terminal domain-containing protein n=1 Tax=Escallonia herrerae TaxID=1293975 RepID=A0AA88WEQ5_9ASTE|nr:hypothetical protein RJ639_043140 [Escallonia herrerae]